MKKMSKFAISFLTIGVLFSIVLGSSATAQAQIAVAILYEDEKAPQWNPANNDGTTFPFLAGDLLGIAQGFGTRIERGTGLSGDVISGAVEDLNGQVEITATSVVRRFDPSETEDLGTGAAFGSISVTPNIGGELQGRFEGQIDLSSNGLPLPSALACDPSAFQCNPDILPWIPGTGTILGIYHLGGESLNLNGPLAGVFLFPIPCELVPLPQEFCPTGFVYAFDETGQLLAPVTQFQQIPIYPYFVPRVKLIANLYN